MITYLSIFIATKFYYLKIRFNFTYVIFCCPWVTSSLKHHPSDSAAALMYSATIPARALIRLVGL